MLSKRFMTSFSMRFCSWLNDFVVEGFQDVLACGELDPLAYKRTEERLHPSLATFFLFVN